MKKIFLILLLLPLLLTGCLITVKTEKTADGGVYKSEDRGDHWTAVSAVYRVGEASRSFGLNDIMVMTVDPTDRQAIYVATDDGSLFYTYNGGQAWNQGLDQAGKINAISVDPNSRCVIYAAINNRVYKSTDCSRHWDYQLIETGGQADKQVLALAIDSFDSRIVYAGTSDGGLFVSSDRAYSWRVSRYFPSRLVKILVNPRNAKIIYAATAAHGVFKSTDNGQTWQNIFEGKFEQQRQSEAYAMRELILDPNAADGLLYASANGLFRSADGGQTWQELKLLTLPKETMIYSIAVNPQNGQEIYYGTNQALYRSQDNGLNWTTRKLPGDRAAKHLFIDPENPQILYLGVKKVN